jgi:predicted amidohydrolase YtcJ
MPESNSHAFPELDFFCGPDDVVVGANQRIGLEEAMKAYTVGGAYTTHEEGVKGRVVAGQFADLVVLDKDPTAIDPVRLPGVAVTMTIVGGKLVYDASTK